MDIGTNSCRLIVAELAAGRDYTHLRQLRITRIGEGLGGGNLHLSRAAMDRTLAALAEYKAMIEGYPVDAVVLLGTQALREADNGREFAAEVKAKIGFDLEIISGRREAFLSYVGAVSGFGGADVFKPLVLDIGAGSTELFWEADAASELLPLSPEGAQREGGGDGSDGSDGGEYGGKALFQGILKGASAPVGGLRLLGKPLDDQGILHALEVGWEYMAVPGGAAESDGADGADKDRPLVAVGGTATTLGAIHLNMKVYDPDALLGLRMSRAQVEDIVRLLESMAPKERLALPGMSPGREDVMPWGLRILLGAMAYCRRDGVTICVRDLLYGALYS
jgi:exopolyphosphatase/guanosine-5'-triphosphate,3'-diphosphate pyrophosphatase